MFRDMVVKELMALLLSLRVGVTAILVTGLMAVSAALFVEDYREQRADYQSFVEENLEFYANTRTIGKKLQAVSVWRGPWDDACACAPSGVLPAIERALATPASELLARACAQQCALAMHPRRCRSRARLTTPVSSQMYRLRSLAMRSAGLTRGSTRMASARRYVWRALRRPAPSGRSATPTRSPRAAASV